MDTIDLSPAAIRAPQLIIANGRDNINGTRRPYDYFRRYFVQGAPWTFVAARQASTGDKPAAGELPSGWLPSAEFAKEWLSFVTRPKPVKIWKP